MWGVYSLIWDIVCVYEIKWEGQAFWGGAGVKMFGTVSWWGDEGLWIEFQHDSIPQPCSERERERREWSTNRFKYLYSIDQGEDNVCGSVDRRKHS